MGLLLYTGLWQVAWCYTRDPTKRWDFCAIPDCGRQPGVIHETPQRDGTFALYRTVVCSLVLYTRPHKEMGLLLYTGLWYVTWCYTRDPTKRWDFCAIPDCDRQPGVILETPQRDGTFPLYWTVVGRLVLYKRPHEEMGLLLYTGLWQVASVLYTRPHKLKRLDFCAIPDCGRQPGVIQETPQRDGSFVLYRTRVGRLGVIPETPQRDGTFALYQTVIGSLGVIQETPQRDGTFVLYRTVVGRLGVIPETPQGDETFALYRTVVCSLVLYTRPHKEMGLLLYTGLWQVAWCYTRDPTN